MPIRSLPAWPDLGFREGGMQPHASPLKGDRAELSALGNDRAPDSATLEHPTDRGKMG